jgi:NADH:ubiquinone oxidoreductase subunit 6 (subunit J)
MMKIVEGAGWVLLALFMLYLAKGFIMFLVSIWPVIQVVAIVGAIILCLQWVAKQFSGNGGGS